MNLQNHLIRGQHQVHDAGGAIGCGEKLQGLCGDAGCRVSIAELIEEFQAALAAVTAGSETAALRLRAGIGRGTHHRHQIAKALLHVTAIGGQIERLHLRELQCRVPVDDASINFESGALGLQQIDFVAQRHRVPGDFLAALIGAGRRLLRQLGKIDHAAASALLGPAMGLLGRALQAARREIAGGGIAHAPAIQHRQHGPNVFRRAHRLQHILSHTQHFGALPHQAQ